ncbi:MAG: DUF2953 domain-containing protein [Oscillospiraceae bacterium]|jgi:hypothetical protein|nr:DUF2953 domain-containing protein [Oscillospiraceae bacterium]
MLVTGIILSVLLLLGFTRFGFRAARTADGGTRVILRAGPFRIDLLKRLQKAKREKAREPEKKEKEAKPGRKISYGRLAGIAKSVLRSVRRGVRVDRLRLRMTVAGGNDPCDAALLYGRLHMAWGTLRPLLTGAFRVKRQRVEIALDFDLDRTRWEGELAVTISLGRSIAVLFAALGAAVRLPASGTNPGKAV